MKTINFLILIFLSLTGKALGQENLTNKSFVIRGQLINCPEDKLFLSYRTKSGKTILDTINLDKGGNFYLKTEKVNEPMIASIQKNQIQVNDFFVAPNYNLIISGDAKDFISLFKSKKISGIGAESNAYRVKLDSMLFAKKDASKWYELNKSDLLKYVNRQKVMQDSLAKVVFDGKYKKDKYTGFFYDMVKYDNQFQKFYMLLAHANFNNYSYNETNDFVNKNFDNIILKDLYNDKYIISSYYKTWVITNEWPSYLLNLDKKRDTTKRQNISVLQKVFQIYPKGIVKDYVMYKLINGNIIYSKSFGTLNKHKDLFKTFLYDFQDKKYLSEINEILIKKEEELTKNQVGKEAPTFTLKSDSNILHSLKDFKGKVVYLDLWASWCKPCREEVPAFKELFNKYNDRNVVFIGIAVSDGEKEWRKALSQDQPTWLQLYDKDNVVWNAYVANSIPRFILIDKEGKIVSFDAPKPSEKEKIERLLDEQISKLD